MNETDLQIQRFQRETRRHGLFLIFLAIVIALLCALGLWLLSQYASADRKLDQTKEYSQRQDTRMGDLEDALEAQRNQFEKCKDAAPETPGCTEPVAPDPEVIPGPEGERGSRGLSCIQEIGYDLCRGPKGDEGDVGKTGVQGRIGMMGQRGLSCVEELGLESCRGPAGNDGTDGTNGTDGAGAAECKDAPASYVCENELQASVANFITKGSVVDLLRALGCTVAVGEGGNPNQIFTCELTGKP